MSLCRRVRCALCERLAQMRSLAVAGAIALPFFAGGCSGVMNVAGTNLLAAGEDDADYAAAENSARAGSATRKLQVPSLMAAENAVDAPPEDAASGLSQIGTEATPGESADDPVHKPGDEPQALPADESLAALSEIQPTGEDAPPRTARERDSSRPHPSKRPPRRAPAGAVSIFGEGAVANEPVAPRSASHARDALRLAAAQEEVPVRRNGVASERTGFDPTSDDEMSVEQIVHWTAQNHPSLAAMRAEVGVAESALVGASLWPNPQLTIDTDNRIQEPEGAEITTRLMFTIPMGFKRSLAQQVADLGIRRAQMAVSRETEVVVDEAIAAAMEVVYYQDLLAVQADLVRLADELVRRVQGDVVPVPDQVTASVNQTSVEFQRLDTLSRLRVARARLSLAMGFDPPRAIRVRATLPDTPAPRIRLETLLAAVRENRPEISEARLAIAESRRARALAQAEAIPDLEVGPRFNDTFDRPEDSLGSRWQFDLPIFARNQDGIAEADAKYQLNQANLRVTQMTTLNQVVAAYAELEPMQRKLEEYRHRIPQLAQQAEAAIQSAFEVGAIDANKMANEQQRLGKLRIEHLNLRYQYNRVRAKIELYAGRSLEQLAAMETTGEGAGERGSPFRDDPDQAPPSQRPSKSATPKSPPPKSATTAPPSGKTPPRTATPKTIPATPKPRKEQVDSRVAGAGRDSNVRTASSESAGKSPIVSRLGDLNPFGSRPAPAMANALPYGAAKPSAAAKK